MKKQEDIKDGFVDEFYRNGQLKYRSLYENGKFIGFYECFHENGQYERGLVVKFQTLKQ